MARGASPEKETSVNEAAADAAGVAAGPFERKHKLADFEAIQSHGGLGLAVTDKGVLLNCAAHFSAYLPSALCVVGMIWGGYWTWLTFVVGWILVPIVDLLVGADSYNLTQEEEKVFNESIWFRVVTWFHLPFQILTVSFGCYWVATHDLTWLEWLGITFSVGTAEGFGIGCVHELIHRPSRFDFMNGVVSLIWSNYGHFWIEHLWGHHRNVASPLDPASAAQGDTVWTFVPRDIVKSFIEAWCIESQIQRGKGRATISIHNRIIQAYFCTFMIAAAYAHFFGAKAVPFFFAQGFIAAWIVENTNYIEHYGLRRKEVRPGEYERVGWLHSWDTPDLLTNSLLFKIQRHPDHHTNANRPYQILRTYPQAPTLPTGYAGMIALSWFPPAFFYVMDWRVNLVKEQDREFRATGKLLGHEYPFPDGARAVYSFDTEADKLFCPKKFIEQATSNQPKFDQYKALEKGNEGVSRYGYNRKPRMFALIFLTVFVALFATLAARSDLRVVADRVLHEQTPRPSLFDRLGGFERIGPLVKDIYRKHYTDPISAEWFKDSDHKVIERRVFEFFSSGTGGDIEYTGRDVLEVHQDMKVSGEALLAIMDHAMSSMEEHGYSQALRNEVLGILFSLKGQVMPDFKPLTGSA